MKLVFECSMPRTGSQLLKNILKQNKELAIQSDSPLHNRFKKFREDFNTQISTATIDSKQLTDCFNNFWINGLKSWGKTINSNAKVYIDSDRMWADDLYTITNSFNGKVIILLRDLKDIINSMDNISKNNSEFKNYFSESYNYNMSSQYQRMIKYFESKPLSVPLTAIKTIIEEDIDNVLFLKYEDLIKTPKDEINKIYKFLNLNVYEHDFENIKSLDRVDTPFLPYGRHTVHSSYKTFKKEKRNLNNEVEKFIEENFKWYYDRFYN